MCSISITTVLNVTIGTYQNIFQIFFKQQHNKKYVYNNHSNNKFIIKEILSLCSTLKKLSGRR